jgi:heptosyltransferase-1
VPPPPNVATFYARTRHARKILVVDLGFLGDSVHLVPACWELKRNYPEAELHTLSAIVGAELLALAPCVDRAWAYPLSNPSPPWWKHLDILRAIRREHFDAAISFSGGDRPIYVTALSGALNRLAHDSGRKHFYNPWLIPDWVSRRPRDLPVFEQRRQVLAAAGMSLAEPRFDLRIPPEARAWAEAQIPAGSIHLSINASSPFKEWPLENWSEFVPKLASGGGRILVATGDGSPREEKRLRTLATAYPEPGLHVLPNRLPLARLAALLSRCSLHVGADSGVTHLALALGAPTVTVYRDYDGLAEWTPPGPQHRQLVARCRCLRGVQPNCAASNRAECLATVAPVAVFDACLALLSAEGSAPRDQLNQITRTCRGSPNCPQDGNSAKNSTYQRP